MPNWVAIQKKEKAKGEFGAGRLHDLDVAARSQRKIKHESVTDFLARGGVIKNLKSK